MHLHYFRTISAFSSNEFVPYYLSASELWETINHVHFFWCVLINHCFWLLPPYDLTHHIACLPQCWLHFISKTISQQPHCIITDQFSNSIATYATWAIQLCAVPPFQTLAEYNILNILSDFFFFFNLPVFVNQIHKVCLWKYETTFFTLQWPGWPHPKYFSCYIF